MRKYVKKSVREINRLVELQRIQGWKVPDAFNLDFIPHYCLLCKDMRNGKVFPCTLKYDRIMAGCTYFAEQDCLDIYRVIVDIMKKTSRWKIVIFNTAAMDGEAKFWNPERQ